MSEAARTDEAFGSFEGGEAEASGCFPVHARKALDGARTQRALEEAWPLARVLAERLAALGTNEDDPEDYRLRLLRAHAFALVDLLEQAAKQGV